VSWVITINADKGDPAVLEKVARYTVHALRYAGAEIDTATLKIEDLEVDLVPIVVSSSGSCDGSSSVGSA